MPSGRQLDSCTGTLLPRAGIQVASSEHVGAAQESCKTLGQLTRKAHRRCAGEGRAATCQFSLFGAIRVSTGIRPSAPIVAVLHTAAGTSISSRSGHSHAMPNSRSALCAMSSCTRMMPWPERRAGAELSQKCFVRITSMLAVQWHTSKRAFRATVLFTHHCDASTRRRLQSWSDCVRCGR